MSEMTHTAGTKSFARVGTEMKKILENSEGSSSHGKIAWESDPYSQILGEKNYGYVSGIVLGPSANEIFKARFEGLRMTTFDETLVEENMRQIKEHMERLEKQVQEQNNNIAKLKHMMQCLATGQLIEVNSNDKKTLACWAIVFIVLTIVSNLLFLFVANLLGPLLEEDEAKKKKEEEKPKAKDKKEEPIVISVVVKVHMHCEACAHVIKKKILKMKSAESNCL